MCLCFSKSVQLQHASLNISKSCLSLTSDPIPEGPLSLSSAMHVCLTLDFER
jgi:hypothetical protein